MIIAGPEAKAETIAAIRDELGLDRPIPIQFAEYIGRVLRGDLGRSIISNKMVSEELALTIGPTVELMLGAMLIAVPLGLALGTFAAVRRGRLSDRVIMAISVAGVSMPVFFIGLILIQYVGYKWGLLPFTGRTGPIWDGGLPSLILPALTLGLVLIGPIARLTRTVARCWVRTSCVPPAPRAARDGGDHPSRAAQSADPRGHADRPAGRLPAGRCGGDRDHATPGRALVVNVGFAYLRCARRRGHARTRGRPSPSHRRAPTGARSSVDRASAF